MTSSIRENKMGPVGAFIVLCFIFGENIGLALVIWVVYALMS